MTECNSCGPAKRWRGKYYARETFNNKPSIGDFFGLCSLDIHLITALCERATCKELLLSTARGIPNALFLLNETLPIRLLCAMSVSFNLSEELVGIATTTFTVAAILVSKALHYFTMFASPSCL